MQTADMLNLPVPKAEYINEVLKPSETQEEMVSSFADRAEAVRDGNVNPRFDNMLKITNDGRKLALDQRLMNEMLPDEPERHNDRRKYRRTRQNRKRYRKPRFDNRKGMVSKDGFAPSIRNKRDCHIRLFEQYAELLPITNSFL